ncbi:MAG: NADAR family protein [Lachnospira sp.]|nr:NADAR family protein [Lachnospira sp.]
MEYSAEMLKKRFDEGERLKYIFFWGHTEKADGISKACFSQWYPCTFEIDGTIYQTAEQYMMAGKARLFQDLEVYHQIMEAAHPKQYKDLGRKIKGFQEDVWNTHKYEIVVAGNLAKFSQNAELKQFLQGTNDRILVEASPYDKIWGIGRNADALDIENPHTWQGQNLLGFALMEVRDRIGDKDE